MEDRRHVLLEEKPFGYRLLKGRTAQATFSGRVVATLVGKDYDRLERAIAAGDEYGLQLFLAKATGQFKHGNERAGKGPRRTA